MNETKHRVWLLGSEVGRGHAFYLDGFHEALTRILPGESIQRASVFDVSRGAARGGWEAVRAAYEWAGRGGVAAAVYQRLRGNPRYDEDTFLLRVLGRDASRWAPTEAHLVVDHPALVGALRGRPQTWYVHGEMVVPAEAAVKRASRIFVPLPETADAFVAQGVERSRLTVTGICIEPELTPLRETARTARLERLAVGRGPLTLAAFSSGAEPVAHVDAISRAAPLLAAAGHRVIVFARRGGRLAKALARACAVAPSLAAAAPSLTVEFFETRADLNQKTAAAFPSFDLVLSPPHERSNWAVALGVPFLLLGPDIGPFAPLNRALLLARGVAAELASERISSCPEMLADLQSSGKLLAMAEAGAGLSTGGFERAAEVFAEEVGFRGP